MSRHLETRERKILLPQLHASQLDALRALRNYRFMALRCGRRWGKTEFAKAWIADALLKGWECAWFAPQHMTYLEVYHELVDMLELIIEMHSRSTAVIRTRYGGRLDFWSLENPNAGRGRRYRRIVIDEAAFTKNGDNRAESSMMAIWEKAIKRTLVDYEGRALITSNTAGKNSDNFFFNICNDSKYGFQGYHAKTADNPILPMRAADESIEEWLKRRSRFLENLKNENYPLVYEQEYEAEFVDWSGAAFFSREKLLVDGRPVPLPTRCEYVFAIIDTASKTGTDNDATAVTYFARGAFGPIQLFILDWDITQIEGALLEIWLPSVFQRLEELARLCGARRGSAGAFIEDKNSGMVLVQQAQIRRLPAHAIKSKLTSLGKDGRAISVSGYVHRELVKYTEPAFDKTSIYKGYSRNHLLDQVESFRIADTTSDREDDLVDAFCYGIAITLGNSEGF